MSLLQVAVVHVGFLNVAFGTVPLSIDQWIGCAAMASTALWVGELRKLLLREWHGRAEGRSGSHPAKQT